MSKNFKGWQVSAKEKEQLETIEENKIRCEKIKAQARARYNDLLTVMLRIDPVLDWKNYSGLIERMNEEQVLIDAIKLYEDRAVVESNHILTGKQFREEAVAQ